MKFDAHNTDRASVYDLDTGQKLTQVASIDTSTGEVVCFETPLRTAGYEVATYTLRYTTIYPIFGGSPWPVLFHCYGNLK